MAQGISGEKDAVISALENIARSMLGVKFPDVTPAPMDTTKVIPQLSFDSISEKLQAFLAILETGKAQADNFAQSLVAILTPLNTMPLIFEDGSGKLQELLMLFGVSEQAAQTFSQAIYNAFTGISTTIEAARGVWTTALTAMQTQFNTTWSAVTSAFGAFRAAFISTWNTLATNLRTIATNLGQSLVNTFLSIWNRIRAINWLSLGVSIIQGVASGIRSAASTLISAAVQAATDAYNTVKAALGISSPSRLFASMGEMIPAGMAQGINKSAGMAIAALEDMVSAMTVPAMTPAMAPAITSGRLTSMPSMLPEIPTSSKYGGGAQYITVNYSPVVSTGSTSEFEAQFVPLVDKAMRRVNRGKV